MAQNTILLKRSALQGKTPDTGSLQLGEVAINTFDGKVFIKRSGSIESIQEILTTDAQITGSLNILGGITGSLFGTSSWANNAISASYSLQATTASFALNFNPEATASFAITASQAQNAELLDGYDSAAFVLSSSYNQFTSSYTSDSASFSASISQLQDFSSSLDSGYVTETELQAATASLSSSIGYLSGSYLASSASFNSSINTLVNLTGSYATTGSNTFQGNQIINGNLNVTGSITGSLSGTASFASNALSASYATQTTNAISASYASQATNADNATSASYALNATNAINATSASYATLAANAITASQALSADYAITASQAIYSNDALSASFATNANTATSAVTASFANDFTVAGTLTAQKIIVQTITSSVDYVTGSTIFGSSLSNTHQFTGSVTITGSLAVNNSNVVLTNQTSSMTVLSASQAQNANNAVSASYALNSTTTTSASYAQVATSASQAQNANTAFSSSYAQVATSASQAQNANTATSASHALNSNTAISASYALSASHATNLTGSVNYVPLFNTPNSTTTSSIYQSGSYSVIINQTNATTDAPEALYVWQPNINSFNVISGKGNSDNYLQLNIQNTNLGTSASSDIVATANNGTETSFYVDMGINNENYIDNGNGVGTANDAYVYSLANNFHIGNAANNGSHLGFFVGGFNVDINKKLQLNPNNLHELTGSLVVHNGIITSSLLGTASFADNATSASYALNSTNTISASYALQATNAISASYALNATSASYAANADLLDGHDSTYFATTGSNTFIGSQIVSGSTLITGSTTLIGTNLISGSLTVSASHDINNPNNKIYGDVELNGAIKFLPVADTINNSLSGSYIYVSGSTNDLYFTQNGNGYANTTRLRWLEGNLYTGLLHGGLISSASSTTFNISSGSGVIVSLNASLTDDPYPTVQYLNWGNFTGQSLTYLTSSIQTFVGIGPNGQIIQQTEPWSDGQYNTSISIGTVLHQNLSTINGFITYPNVAYGYKQRTYDFIKAFGPLKLSGYTLLPSGSSTGSLVVGSGTAWADGRNYQVDPNNPSYITDPGTNISKIFRYYQSGSSFVQNTNNGNGFLGIDPGNYNPNGSGSLTPVSPGSPWTNQRVFWYPNSATKGIVVYYGTAQYTTLTEAINNLPYEQFVETPNTAQNAIYLGAIAIKYNGSLQNSADFRILPGGIFRSVGGSGGGGSVVTSTLTGLSDVAIAGPTNLQPLVYSSVANKWINSSDISGSLYGNAQTATSASYASIALSSSYSNNATSASYALTASFALNVPVTASYAISASQATNANNATSSSYALVATSASYAINATTAATASYVLNAISASFATSASQATNANTATSASFASQASSSRYAATSSYADNFNIKNTYTFDGTLNDYSTLSNSVVGVNNVFTQPTGSYTSAFFKYTVQKGLIARTGEVMAVWNDGEFDYTDTSTNDIGNGTTADVIMYVTLAGPNVELNANTLSSGWSVKALATYM